MTYRTIRIFAFCATLIAVALAIHAWLASRDEQQRLKGTLAAQKQLLDAADARERARETALNATLAQIEKLKRAAQTPEEIVRDLPKYLPLPQPIRLIHRESSAPRAPWQGTDEPATIVNPVQPALSQAEQGNRLSPSSSASRASRTPGDDQGGGRLKLGPRGPNTTAIPEGIASQPQAAAPQGQDSSAPAAACSNTRDCSAQIPAADLKPLYDFVQDCRGCQAQLAAARQNSDDDRAKITALTRERDAAITASKGGSFWRRLRHNTLWFFVGAATGAAAGYAVTR
jgi:hypothetical protein